MLFNTQRQKMKLTEFQRQALFTNIEIRINTLLTGNASDYNGIERDTLDKIKGEILKIVEDFEDKENLHHTVIIDVAIRLWFRNMFFRMDRLYQVYDTQNEPLCLIRSKSQENRTDFLEDIFMEVSDEEEDLDDFLEEKLPYDMERVYVEEVFAELKTEDEQF